MKRFLILSVTLAALFTLCHVKEARAQSSSDDLQKFEVGVHFTTLTKPSYGQSRTDPGFGGRLTYNLTKSLAVEAEGNFFPENVRSSAANENMGRGSEALFGVKAGRRFGKFGIFGKARPGLAHFSGGNFDLLPVGTVTAGTFPALRFDTRGLNAFAFDLGGVLEFYPSRRIVTRFDAGDTLIRYGQRSYTAPSFNVATGQTSIVSFPLPAETRHNFQFTAGVGFRF